MLDSTLLSQVKQIFASLDAEYTFNIIYSHGHENANELIDFLNDVASCSDKINCSLSESHTNQLKFELLKNGEPTGIAFRGIPGGHEFSSLLLAVLNADGKGKNLPDESLSARIKALQGKIELTTFVSLTCTNCPDVVQALNVMALLNDNISHTMVDGAIFTDEAESLNVQSVPSVFANGKLIHVGRGSIGELLNSLEDNFESAPTFIDTTPRDFDVLVIGGGPAGTSAAIYSARKGLKVAVIGERIGGQVNETVGIENLISIGYTTGTELANDLRKHLTDNDVSIFDNRKIETVDLLGKTKTITTKGGERFSAPAVIIATGASWRRLGVEGEAEYIGRGVAFCPHCDGPFYKGRHVAVIGGGNSGIEAAIDLAGICSKVTVLEFADTLKADKVLQEKAESLSNVEIYTSIQTTKVIGNGSKVTGIAVKNRQTNEESEIPLDGIFVQIGLSANSAPFKDQLGMSNIGEIKIDERCRTAVAGVYAAGDVSTVPYKQIVIAMGEGAKAALSAFDDRTRGII